VSHRTAAPAVLRHPFVGKGVTEAIEVDAVRLDVLRHDPATQVIEENHVTLTAGGCLRRFLPARAKHRAGAGSFSHPPA
jgi:hypothetical protein